MFVESGLPTCSIVMYDATISFSYVANLLVCINKLVHAFNFLSFRCVQCSCVCLCSVSF